MEEFNQIIDFITSTRLLAILHALVLLAMGYLTARISSVSVLKLLHKEVSVHGRQIIKRFVFVLVFLLFGVSALKQLGIDLSLVLGAAGILTVALGFASQTSASNLISGLFLMIERPFSIGDVIRIEDNTGEVISVDLLSVKLRTFDNLFVRIPNESMIKTPFTTLTKFPIRRADLKLGIAYKEDVERVRNLLTSLAANNPLCLDEPAPLFILVGFGDSSVDIQFSVWAQRENFLALKNSLYEEIKTAFDREGIEIPFPHISVYSGSATSAMPIELIQENIQNPPEKD